MNSYEAYYVDLIGEIVGGYIAIVVIGCIIALALLLIFAHFAGKIAKKKGYPYGGYFALTLFLGIIGLIIAACLPSRSQNSQAPQSVSQFWVCGNCGTTNEISGSFCSQCGQRKK